jgi:diguanylate cyclase (GGDEF)-like protein
MTATARPKILCVDDEESLLHALDRVFKSQFDVLTTPSPRAALELLAANPDVAVVLSDYRMPEMNGLEFLREVRVRHPLMSRAVLSGQIDLHNVSDAINRADIHKFILKPWENEYLSLQMLEALQLHRTLRERDHYARLALTDPVTEVGNHRAFQDDLRRLIGVGSAPVALVIFDVDNFKSFNDQFGHPRGDQLLRRMAATLAECAAGRGLVARYGGEEFTVILPGHDVALARTFAEEVRGQFERDPINVTVSAGLAVYPGDAGVAADLIALADQALYRAKAAGRNRVFTCDQR